MVWLLMPFYIYRLHCRQQLCLPDTTKQNICQHYTLGVCFGYLDQVCTLPTFLFTFQPPTFDLFSQWKFAQFVTFTASVGQTIYNRYISPLSEISTKTTQEVSGLAILTRFVLCKAFPSFVHLLHSTQFPVLVLLAPIQQLFISRIRFRRRTLDNCFVLLPIGHKIHLSFFFTQYLRRENEL